MAGELLVSNSRSYFEMHRCILLTILPVVYTTADRIITDVLFSFNVAIAIGGSSRGLRRDIHRIV